MVANAATALSVFSEVCEKEALEMPSWRPLTKQLSSAEDVDVLPHSWSLGNTGYLGSLFYLKIL